jgi:hypothetical protein
MRKRFQLIWRKAAFRPDRDFHVAENSGLAVPSSGIRLEHEARRGAAHRAQIINERPRLVDGGQPVAPALFAGAHGDRAPMRGLGLGWRASSRTTLRWLNVGTMRETPSSVAFCTMKSMRSPRGTACTSVTASVDSRSTRSA